MSPASAQMEAERSVRDRLYGERAMVTATPAPPPPRRAGPGRLLGGRYRLLECAGVGGMATVYRARDERLKRDVAVKVIAEHLGRDPKFVRRFRGEAELCAGLAHPNIVGVLDAGVEPRDFIVMELVRGVDAGRLLRRRARLTPGQTVHLVAQICDALAYVHDRDLVHRDVTPRNILVRLPDGAAKLADFGLASSALEPSAKRAPDVMGTPGYVAPEVLSGGRPSPLSDLYSVGVLAYRFLVGPSRGRPHDPDATAPRATTARRMPPLAEARPDLSRPLVEAVQQAVAYNPGARQESVAQFGAQLVDASKPRLEVSELKSGSVLRAA